MVCANCNRAKADHALRNDILWCIGVEGTYRVKITNLNATFLYRNTQGVGESRDAILMSANRKLARLDNIVEELIANGNTDISINLTNS